jgi:hypothetical protein
VAVGYEGLVVVYIVLALVGSAVLVAARYFIKQESTVILRGVGVRYALRVASHALYATEDNRVGFPSGKFGVADGETPNVIVAKEFKPKDSHRVVLNMFLVPWFIAGSIVLFITAVMNNGWAFLLGQVARVITFTYFMFFFIVPLLLALAVELILKRFVASVITVQATEGDNEVRLHFTFRGASALLVKSRLLKSFEAPVLPPKYHTPAMARIAQPVPASVAA